MKLKTVVTAILCALFIQNVISESYDYSKIAPHPRLLMDEAGEQRAKEAVQNVEEYKMIHEYILQVADEFVKAEPLTRVMKGKRLLAVSRDALTRIYYLAYSYRMTENEVYLHRAEKELNAVCDFTDWNPSHFLDVGEMSVAVAIGYDWLFHDLQESTKRKIEKAIKDKAFTPSRNPRYTKFLGTHNNWNSVCNAGLLYGALAIFEANAEESVEMIERTLESNKLPLTVFAPDGNYPEGPGYWNYGTTFQVMLIAALESALGSDNGLSDAPGFMKTADYMLYAGGPSGLYFNYYDCGARQTARSTMFWFADKLQKPSLLYLEKEMINDGIYTNAVSSDIERILPNAIVFGKGIDLSKVEPPKKELYVGHGLTPVAIVRTDWTGTKGKYFGIKGGSASDGHSHMDQGTFVYDVGRTRWAMDFGMQSYITMEREGVDIWNLTQEAERWTVFRYNNLNHNTLTINNQRHNVKGRADIIETYDQKGKLGAKLDLTSVLNFNDELKSATRKALLIDEEYLQIEDIVETNDEEVHLRWNMVTPSEVEIVDKKTIKLTQGSKTMYLEVQSKTPFKLVVRPSENPSQEKCEFTNSRYGTWNQKNEGTVMIGFDANIEAHKKGRFVVILKEGEKDLKLKKNIIVLDAPNPNTGSEGDRKYEDISPIKIDGLGDVFAAEKPDWLPYGWVDIDEAYGKTFGFRIAAQRIYNSGIVKAGIDRANNGHLGIRTGENNGIENNEGCIIGLNLSQFDESVSFQLTKIAITFFDPSESCIIVNRKNTMKMLSLKGNDNSRDADVKVTSNHTIEFIDISDLDIMVKGGSDYAEIASVFNTGGGSFRIKAFELKIR